MFLKDLFKTFKTFHDASKMIDLKGIAPNGTDLVHLVFHPPPCGYATASPTRDWEKMYPSETGLGGQYRSEQTSDDRSINHCNDKHKLSILRHLSLRYTSDTRDVWAELRH